MAEITRAAEVGAEEARARRRRFVGYQERGLLGKACAKVPRRGGEGLWHPTQAALWRLYERQRLVVRPTTLANAPVGAWLLGYPGLELSQVQQAFDYWARGVCRAGKPSADERSVSTRRIREAVDQIADEKSTIRIRRELSRIFGNAIDSAGTILRERSIEVALAAALSPDAPPHDDVLRHASGYHRGLSANFTALMHLDALKSEKSVEMWTWARQLIQMEEVAYRRDQPMLRQHPLLGRFYDATADTNSFINTSCMTLLMIFGFGIQELTGDAPAVRLKGVDLPPRSLAALFSW